MKGVKVLLKTIIIEDDYELAIFIRDNLSKLGRFEITGIAQNGEQGLNLIRTQVTDVVIIDLIMPYGDGLYVLDELAKNPEIKPICMAISGYEQSNLVHHVGKRGADYFLYKPIDINTLATRIEEVWEEKSRKKATVAKSREPAAPPMVSLEESTSMTPEAFMWHVLQELGIPHTLSGRDYMKTAFALVEENDNYFSGKVMAHLYPAIAKIHGVTPQQVERAIRHALGRAWKKDGGRTYNQILGLGGPESPRPTNSQFIFALVDYYNHKCKDHRA